MVTLYLTCLQENDPQNPSSLQHWNCHPHIGAASEPRDGLGGGGVESQSCDFHPLPSIHCPMSLHPITLHPHQNPRELGGSQGICARESQHKVLACIHPKLGLGELAHNYHLVQTGRGAQWRVVGWLMTVIPAYLRQREAITSFRLA